MLPPNNLIQPTQKDWRLITALAQERREEMKALSIQQPWAWAIFHGKDAENRTWRTDYRGPLWIHTGKGFDDEGYAWLIKHQKELDILVPPLSILHRGVILGKADLVDCVTESDSLWFFGPYGFVLDEPILFGWPTPYKGQLGIFEIPNEVIFR